MNNKKINFLYCFDENYNMQANNSISSLLENVSEQIGIYIIHKDPSTFEAYLNKFKLNNKLDNIEIFKFDKSLIKSFPRVENTHISDATYYRLFIDKYLPSKVEYITYLDADIICFQCPIETLRQHIQTMEKENLSISSKTETIFNEELTEINNRLNLKSKKYFNAGVMIINFTTWVDNQTSKNLLEELIRIKDIIYYWDQDVLNSYFDGEYLELSTYLNFNLHLTKQDYFDKTPKEDKNKMIFIHYAGSHKPWSIRGIYNPKSIYYQQQHMKLHNKYHVVNTWRVDALKRLIVGLITFRIIFVRNPIRFFIDAFVSLLKSNKK